MSTGGWELPGVSPCTVLKTFQNVVSLGATKVSADPEIRSSDPRKRNCYFADEKPLKAHEKYSQVSQRYTTHRLLWQQILWKPVYCHSFRIHLSVHSNFDYCEIIRCCDNRLFQHLWVFFAYHCRDIRKTLYWNKGWNKDSLKFISIFTSCNLAD